jgi:hypothetical protein
MEFQSLLNFAVIATKEKRFLFGFLHVAGKHLPSENETKWKIHNVEQN